MADQGANGCERGPECQAATWIDRGCFDPIDELPDCPRNAGKVLRVVTCDRFRFGRCPGALGFGGLWLIGCRIAWSLVRLNMLLKPREAVG
jgi:hypothetical protein